MIDKTPNIGNNDNQIPPIANKKVNEALVSLKEKVEGPAEKVLQAARIPAEELKPGQVTANATHPKSDVMLSAFEKATTPPVA